MNRKVRALEEDDKALYNRFLADVGTNTLELRAFFAEEIRRLPQEDLVILKDFDFTRPETMTKQQQRILTRILATAAAKAKHQQM